MGDRPNKSIPEKRTFDIQNVVDEKITIIHDLNTKNVITSFYDEEFNLLPEVRVTIIDPNTIEFRLGLYYVDPFSKLRWRSSPYKGKVRVVVIG